MHAAAGRELRVMLPMVTEVAEVRQARALLEREIAHFRMHGHAEPAEIQLGAMVEVPSLLFQLDELFRVVDFASVGSNDLLQFVMASDRSNTRLAGRFDPLSPAFLRPLRKITRAAAAAGKPLTLCGEIAGRPVDALALAAIGFRSLSMASAAIGPVKAAIRALELKPLAERLGVLIDGGATGSEIRNELQAWAEAERIPI
jgi:phosphotransferase system enzyme I (PtsP)